jgi:putative hydrolase of the HAD superfamily
MQDKFVYFDLGNVLVNFDHDIAVENVASLTRREAAAVKHALFTSGLQDQLETGLITSAEFADRVVQSLECELHSEALLDAISAIFHPNEGIVAILEQLKQSGVPMAVLSNTCEPHWQWILRQNWPVMQGWFDFYILSYEARSMKPDAGIYEISEQRSGRQPEQLFLTDDRADNVAAARARGWTTHQFTSVDLLAEELGPWLDLKLDPRAMVAPRPAK